MGTSTKTTSTPTAHALCVSTRHSQRFSIAPAGDVTLAIPRALSIGDCLLAIPFRVVLWSVVPWSPGLLFPSVSIRAIRGHPSPSRSPAKLIPHPTKQNTNCQLVDLPALSVSMVIGAFRAGKNLPRLGPGRPPQAQKGQTYPGETG